MNAILKTSELGDKVGLTRQQIHKLAVAGKLPGAVKPGKHFLFDTRVPELTEWIRERRQNLSAKRRDAARSAPVSGRPTFDIPMPPFNLSRMIKEAHSADEVLDAVIYSVGWLGSAIEKGIKECGGVSALPPITREVLKARLKMFADLHAKIGPR